MNQIYKVYRVQSHNISKLIVRSFVRHPKQRPAIPISVIKIHPCVAVFVAAPPRLRKPPILNFTPGHLPTSVKPRFSQKGNKMRDSRRILEIWRMGVVKYSEGLKLQEKLVSDRKDGKVIDTLLSLQHPHTYTLGKRRTDHNLLVSESELKSMGAELHYTQRGGDITYHGPRQAILYPVINLRDMGFGARKYVEKLEQTMIELASLYGVKARAGETGETGVWVGERKIGAIGVRISSGITSHGLAFNIDPDLNYFKNIVPCGIADKEVTSLKNEVGIGLPKEEFIREQLVSCFAKLFNYKDVLWKDDPVV